jgi:hypothetical protein
MRGLSRLLLILVLAVPVLMVAAICLAIDGAALVAGQATFTPAHIERAHWLLARNDPRYMRAGVLRTIVISQEDLDLTANYLANRYARGASQIVLLDGRATLRASIALPANPLGGYINLDAAFRETNTLPRVERFQIGSLRLPAFLCNWLLDRGLRRLQDSANFAAAADVIKQVRSHNGFLSVQFEWNDAVPGQLKAALVDEEDQARWRVYQHKLVELAEQTGNRRAVPLDQLLVPLLVLASERAKTGDVLLENRAALIVLAFYVNGKGLAALVPKARQWPRAKRHIVTLNERTDLSQHFSISAALAATAGSPLSDAVGLYKELDDARGGSGFSFNDIAADRAGTRLGEWLVQGHGAAERARRALARGLGERDLMPDVRDLPEFLTEAQFKHRFGGVGQPGYQAMLADIERRIAALSIYR